MRRKAEIDWNLLSHAINHTVMFETLLNKRFPIKDEFNFEKIIWQIFDKHMDIFIESQSKSLTQFVEERSIRIRSGKEKPLRETNTTAVPLSSSAELFLLLKKIITESTKLCARPDAILKFYILKNCKIIVFFRELAKVFSQCLRGYGHGCLSAFLPQTSSSSQHQGLIGSSSLLQNFMREDTSLRLSLDSQYFTCCLLATADWCAETTLQLQEKLRQRIPVICFIIFVFFLLF